MHAVVTFVFALCAVTVQVTHSQNYDIHPKKDNNCVGNTPKIFILSAGYMFFTDGDNNEAVIPYGSSVKVWCQCYGVYAAGLVMKKHGITLSADTEDETSITWSTGKLDLQKRTEYSCAVKETVCEDKLFVSVTPALDVISPKGQFNDEATHTPKKLETIEYGNSLSVLCSGPTAPGLILMKDGKQLPTEQVNSSTINWFERRPDLQTSTYMCTDIHTGYNRSVAIKVVPVIYGEGVQSVLHLHGGFNYNYNLAYEDTSVLFCTGPRAVKFISLKNDDKQFTNENINDTTMQLSVTSLEMGISTFACVDSEFPDYMSTVRVTVKPRMVLTSPNIHCNNRRCVAKKGDPLELICSGPDAAQLTMDYYSIKIKRNKALQILNATSIKWLISKLDLRADYLNDTYVCSTGEVMSVVDVEVLPHPEALDFQCISYDLHYLNCTWTTLSNRNNFTIYYILNGFPIRIYERSQSRAFSSTRSRFCVWYNTDYPAYPRDVAVLSFIMQSCNSLGCFNQTFHFNHLSILKSYSPEGLTVHRKSSRYVELSWNAANTDLAGEYLVSKNGDFNYRIEYWYPGIEPLEANYSNVPCYAVSCFIGLTLPCSEQWYEVRVYQKLNRAVGEQFWSNPTSVTFYVEAEPDKMNTSAIDSACYKGPRKTKYVMVYFVQKLGEEVHLDKQKINKEVISLKKKLDMIKTYLREKKDRLILIKNIGNSSNGQ